MPRNTLGAKRRPRRVRWEGAANDLSGTRGALCHELVYVVVVAVLDASADPPGPRGPEAVADPALSEGGHARRGRPVRGIASVEGVREIEVLHLDRVSTGGYPREYVIMLTDRGEGRVVLD